VAVVRSARNAAPFRQHRSKQFREVSNCDVRRVVMPEGSPKDLCQMEAKDVVKIFGEFS